MTTPGNHDEDPFVREIRRQARRAGASGHVTFLRGLSLVGSVGWMVVVPALLGAFLGRFIDRRIGTPVFWTLSLLFLGLTLGCTSAWRHVHQELEQ
jgi:ATP synthase protein I